MSSTLFGSLLLPLISGYLYITIHPVKKFLSLTFTGYRFLLLSATWGMIFLVFSYVVKFVIILKIYPCFLTDNLCDASSYELPKLWHSFNIPFSFVSIMAIMSGILWGIIGKLFINSNKEYKKALDDTLEPFDLLTYEATDKKEELLIVLKCKKFIIGFVKRSKDLQSNNGVLSLLILPRLSGHYEDNKRVVDSEYSFLPNDKLIEVKRVSEVNSKVILSSSISNFSDYAVIVPISEIEFIQTWFHGKEVDITSSYHELDENGLKLWRDQFGS